MVRPSSLHGNPGPDTYRDISIFDRGPLRLEEVPSSTYSVSSSGDVVEGDDIEFVIRRSGGLTSAGSVQFQVKSGSAKFEEDFLTVDGYQTINFDALEASSVNYVEKIITVATVDDEEIEMDEFLMAMLRPSSPYDQIAAMTARAVIENNDEIAKYSMSFDSKKIEEGESLVFDINRTSDQRNAEILLSLKSSGAEIGADIIDIGEMSIDFQAGESSKTITLGTIDDEEVEISEGFFVRINSESKVEQIDNGIQYIEIEDNDEPSDFTLLQPSSTSEGDGVVFTIERSGDISRNGSVYFWTKNGTAKKSDFTSPELIGEKQLVSFEAESTQQTVTVDILDDDAVEDEEFFYGFIKPFQIEDRILKNSRKAEIIDDDVPVEYSFKVGIIDDEGVFQETNDFTESDVITFEISRSRIVSGGSVDLKLRSATAKSDKDFLLPILRTNETDLGEVFFDDDQLSALVTVDTIDDYSVEGDEFFFASLKANNRTDVIAGRRQQINIQDDDTEVTYALSFIPLVVDENGDVQELEEVVGDDAEVAEGGTARLRISRSGGNHDAPGQVKLRTMAGNAKDSVDYVGLDKQVIVIPAGSTEYTVDIEISEDYKVERDESFSAVIKPVGKRDNIQNRQQTITILDDDEPAVFSISAVETEIQEAGEAVLTISKTGGEGRTSSVVISTGSDSARAGKDFEKNVLQVDFEPGDSTSKTITIPMIDDEKVETDEEFFVVNIKPKEAQDSVDDRNSSLEFEIIDNDTPAEFSIAADSENIDADGNAFVNEAGEFVFTVTKASGGEGRTSSIVLNTTDGTAKSGKDYAAINSAQIDFTPDGPTNLTITIQTGDDEAIEGGSESGENFYLDIKTLDSVDSIRDGESRLDIEITDDDEPAEFSITTSEAEVTEGENIVLEVSRSGGEGRSSTVILTTSNGSAQSGRDYKKQSREFVFLSDSDESQYFTIETVDDESIEGDSTSNEDFSVKFEAVDPLDSIVGSDDIELAIVDNDKPAVFDVSAAEANQDDNGKDFKVDEAGSIELTIEKTGGEGRTSFVYVSTKNASARSGADYTGLRAELEFSANDVSKTLTIQTTADEEIEGGDGLGEEFLFRVKPLDEADSVNGDSSRNVTIVDDDEPAQFNISVADANLEDNDKDLKLNEADSMVVTIEKTGGEGRTSTLFIKTKNGSAFAGSDSDYIAVKQELEFPEDVMSQTLTIETNSDELIEGGDDVGETFDLKIKVLDDADEIIGGSSRTVTIVDDDEPAEFSISAAETDVEEGEDVLVTIAKTGGEGRSSLVRVVTKNGSARSGSDYEGVESQIITFDADDFSETITIQTFADEEVEGSGDSGENFFFDIKPINQLDSIDGDTRLTLTILDPVAGSDSNVVSEA